jgi:hypothetical protein
MKTIAGVDGRLLRSLRALLLHPGSLTLAYGEGRRKPFIGPFQLFLLANVVFFAVQSLTHTRVFSSSLDSHLHHQDWSALAQELVGHRLAAANTTLDRFAPLFDRAVVLHAKSLVIAMAVPFALLLPVVFSAAGGLSRSTPSSPCTCTRSCCCSSALPLASPPSTWSSAEAAWRRHRWTTSSLDSSWSPRRCTSTWRRVGSTVSPDGAGSRGRCCSRSLSA